MNEQHISREELEKLTLTGEADKLFLVKWKNLSYTDITWEAESDLKNPSKIADYYRFNKAIDP